MLTIPLESKCKIRAFVFYNIMLYVMHIMHNRMPIKLELKAIGPLFFRKILD